MKHHHFIPWARKLTVLSVPIALIATVYAFGAATPQEAIASSHEVVYVAPNWSLKPSGVHGGEQFRLIFYSSAKRDAESDDIADYNTFVQDRAAAGHADIQIYADEFRAVGCTEVVDARNNTFTNFTSNNKGVPIYWLSGRKVADNAVQDSTAACQQSSAHAVHFTAAFYTLRRAVPWVVGSGQSTARD